MSESQYQMVLGTWYLVRAETAILLLQLAPAIPAHWYVPLLCATPQFVSIQLFFRSFFFSFPKSFSTRPSKSKLKKKKEKSAEGEQ